MGFLDREQAGEQLRNELPGFENTALRPGSYSQGSLLETQSEQNEGRNHRADESNAVAQQFRAKTGMNTEFMQRVVNPVYREPQ